MQEKIFLAEQPHLVIQGEGNLIGKKMLLFRVSGCNVKCKDCDSTFTWQEKSTIDFTFEQFRDYIYSTKIKTDFDFIMITGGAPSLYKEFLYSLIGNLQTFQFQIEDAGDSDWSSFRNLENVYFSFSPKIGALESQTEIQDWKAFDITPKNWICKIVVDKNNWENNLESIKDLQNKYNISNNKIYLMPKGIYREEIIEQSQFLIDKCFEYGFNFSTRLHILIYNNKRLV